LPIEPATSQERQVPVQALAQQTPCAQNPEPHDGPAVQVWPLGKRPQVPAVQTLGAKQSASEAQMVLHAPAAPQTYGLQACTAAVTQAPLPSHLDAGVSIPTAQTLAAQTVVEG
jgi:hypothetical protein